MLSEATSEYSLRRVLCVANHRTRYSNRSSSEETLIEEMKKDEKLSKKCFNRQKADGPTHHKARMRLINLANLGDLARSGSVPGKKVLRIYSGTPSRLLGLPGFAGFCKSIVAKRDQKSSGKAASGVYVRNELSSRQCKSARKRDGRRHWVKATVRRDPVYRHQQTYFYLDPAERGVISGRSPC